MSTGNDKLADLQALFLEERLPTRIDRAWAFFLRCSKRYGFPRIPKDSFELAYQMGAYEGAKQEHERIFGLQEHRQKRSGGMDLPDVDIPDTGL